MAHAWNIFSITRQPAPFTVHLCEYRHLETRVLGQAVLGGPGTLGWAPSRLDAEVLWRMLGGALLALAPWTYSLKARLSRPSRPPATPRREEPFWTDAGAV